MLANLTPNIVGCYMLGPFAHPVACCCAKFETSQTFQPTTPNISFVPWSPKRRTTMLDSFAQLFQHCWGHARLLRMDCKDLWVVSFPLLGVVVSVCTQPQNWSQTVIFKQYHIKLRTPMQNLMPNIFHPLCLVFSAHRQRKSGRYSYQFCQSMYFPLQDGDVGSRSFRM